MNSNFWEYESYIANANKKYIDITKDDKNLPVLIKLVKWIQAIQRKSGEFYPHKQTYPDGEPEDFISQDYPGEALLALVRIFTLQPDFVIANLETPITDLVFIDASHLL